VLPAGANLNNYSQVLLSTALGLIISLIATSSLFANQGIRHWQLDHLRRRLRLRAQPTKP
jgi:biopolymer transport protein ExbB